MPGMTAHPKIRPVTGEMVVFRYDVEEPYLAWGIVGADGTVSRALETIEVDGPYMIHDFTVTESSVLIFIGPLLFDFDAMFAGGDLLAWQPERGMRIAVIDRSTGALRWIHTDPFWVWHFANAYDRNGPAAPTRSSSTTAAGIILGGIIRDDSPVVGAITRAVIDPAAGTFRTEVMSDTITDFARIDDRIAGHEHRYFVVTGISEPHPNGQHNVLVHVDTQTGDLTTWDGGTSDFAEVCFVPAPGGAPEAGFYVTYRTDLETLASDFVILAADDIAAGPIARVPLPHRVPAGLHGNWLPAT